MKAGQITKAMEKYFYGCQKQFERDCEKNRELIETLLELSPEKKDQIVKFVRKVELQKGR